MEFKPRRQTTFRNLRDGQEFTVFEAECAGCVRHLWITTGTSGRGIRIRIHVDDLPDPQVEMELNRFFGILLDRDPYLVESPGVSVLSQIAYKPLECSVWGRPLRVIVVPERRSKQVLPKRTHSATYAS